MDLQDTTPLVSRILLGQVPGADLRLADLSVADLRWADLTGANLTNATICGGWVLAAAPEHREGEGGE